MSRKREQKTRTGHEMSKQYVEAAKAVDGQPWRIEQGYIVGVKVVWFGVRLVCTRPHYAGTSAEHPWDAAYGWPVAKAATLFAPADEIEAAKLKQALHVIEHHGLPGGARCEGGIVSDDAATFSRLHMQRLRGIYEELAREGFD